MGWNLQSYNQVGYIMRTRRSFTPLSILCSIFLLLIILGVSIISFVEICIIYVWGALAAKCKTHLKI
jgi:hypothetical protein